MIGNLPVLQISSGEWLYGALSCPRWYARVRVKRFLCDSSPSIDTGESPVNTGPAPPLDQPQVIPSQGDLLGDLLNLDLGPPVNVPQVSSMQMGAVDLLGGGLDSLVSLPSYVDKMTSPADPPRAMMYKFEPETAQ